MKDIWEPTLSGRIEEFLDRKDQEFPELDLSKRWHDYQPPRRKSYFIRQPR